jgi:WXG100 family type VII secretion target
MSKLIKVTPEELERIGDRFLKCSDQNRSMAKELDQLINGLNGQWQGVAKERFYTSYKDADEELKNVSALLENVGDELKAIALRFRTADGTR